MSFLTMLDGPGRPRPTGRRGDEFSVFIGYYHPVAEEEMTEIVDAAGLRVIAMRTDATGSHMIVQRALPQVRGQR